MAVVGEVGLEPTARGLKARYSTVELFPKEKAGAIKIVIGLFPLLEVTEHYNSHLPWDEADQFGRGDFSALSN